MELEKEAAGIAQDGAHLVATPERGGGSGAILTYWLQIIVVSIRGHSCALCSQSDVSREIVDKIVGDMIRRLGRDGWR